MDAFFIGVSALAFIMGIVWLIVSAVGLSLLIRRVMPLLTETKDNIQDLGDLSANTVGRISDSMDLVEMRVTQAMGNATEAGTSVTKQALSFGTLLAGVFVALRIGGLLRSHFQVGKVGKEGKGKKQSGKKRKGMWK